MGKWAAAVVLGVWCWAGPAAAHEKRADKCGCHHQYGLRHCHPKYKTKTCEAPVKATETVDLDQVLDHEHPEEEPNQSKVRPRSVRL